MEVQGAAVATLIGNIFGAGFGLYIVLLHRKAVDFAHMTVSSMQRAWKIIGHVGLPAAGTNIIVPVSTFAAVAIVGIKLTEADVAAFTVASRVELISVGLLYALSACIGAITGRNGGAGHTERVRAAFRVLFAPQIAGFFTKDAILVEKILPYFFIVPITLSGR